MGSPWGGYTPSQIRSAWDSADDTDPLEPRPGYLVGGALGGGTAKDTTEADPLEPHPGSTSNKDQLLPNAPYDSFDMLAHGATFGLTDPMRAGMRATTDYLFGDPNAAPGEEPRGFDFQRRSEEIARGRQQYQAAHPWISTGADLLGSVAMMPARVGQAIATTAEKAPSLWRQFAASTGLGTVGGAVTGAADNPDDRLGGALKYGVGGAIGGAISPLAMRAGTGIAQGYRNYMDPAGQAGANAMDRLSSILRNEERLRLPSAADLDARLAASRAPLTLADVSPGVRSYVGTQYDRGTSSAGVIGEKLLARDEEAGGRILGELDRTAATGPHTFEADAIMKKQQQAKAAPLYNDAYMQPPINPDIVAPGGEIGSLMTRPSIQKAFGHARNLAAEEGRDPNSMGLTFDMDGNAKFQGVPSWQTLDYVKRGIDRVINDFPRHPITNAIQVNEEGRAVLQTLSEFKDILTRNNPQYGQALQTFSGDQASRNALALGADALTHKSAAEQAHIYSLLDPGDQQFFRLGATNEARSRIGNTTDLADETKKLAGSPEKREKLALLFNTPDAHANFLQMLKDERAIFDTNQRIAGNSASARRLGAMAAEEPTSVLGGAIPTAVTAFGASLGDPGVTTAATLGSILGKPIQRAAERFSQTIGGQGPFMGEAATNMALQPGARARQILGLLTAAPPDRRAAPAWVPGTMAGVNIPGSVPALSNPIAQFLAGTRAPPLTEAERAALALSRSTRPGTGGRLPR